MARARTASAFGLEIAKKLTNKVTDKSPRITAPKCLRVLSVAPKHVLELSFILVLCFAASLMAYYERRLEVLVELIAGLSILAACLVLTVGLALRRHSDLLVQLAAEKVRADDASRAKASFLAHMSHEFRTPLNAIIGFSEVMEEAMLGPLGTEKYREYSHDIRESGQHLLKLVDQVLHMADAQR